jgi:hypothetical protein
MNKAYEQYLKDENYRASILAAARTERTKAIRSLIIEPLRALLKNPPLRQTRMLRRSAYC